MLILIQERFILFHSISAIDLEINMSVIEETSSFTKFRLSFTFTLHWGSYIASTPKNCIDEIGTLIRSMRFMSSEFVLTL